MKLFSICISYNSRDGVHWRILLSGDRLCRLWNPEMIPLARRRLIFAGYMEIDP